MFVDFPVVRGSLGVCITLSRLFFSALYVFRRLVISDNLRALVIRLHVFTLLCFIHSASEGEFIIFDDFELSGSGEGGKKI